MFPILFACQISRPFISIPLYIWTINPFKGSSLEELEIIRYGIDYMWTLDVYVPSLKRLTLKVRRNKEDKYLDNFEGKVTVNAPNIEHLDLRDCASDKILMNHLSSLAKARRLWLTGYTLQTLNYANPANLPTFCNVIHLELGLDELDGLVLLPNLLESSPKLEVLVLREGITLPGGRTHNYKIRDYKYHWIPPQQIPECLICCLKTIVFHKFSGTEEEMNLVKYLLKNAMVLENMTVFCHGDFSFNADELSNYARCESNCDFILRIPKRQGGRRLQIMVPSNHVF
ncbi:hypothetical protein Vadar_008915 [Vaccinium darrowii]|uniref:Uncharacterized protein n=1 Tax=Vaccinium darrowii TaxID=229202 RepID=A0ACB7Z2M0_9ERIC|nr:hypothetical protein Vadar_008915 [Vaccinium darrowii]